MKLQKPNINLTNANYHEKFMAMFDFVRFSTTKEVTDHIMFQKEIIESQRANIAHQDKQIGTLKEHIQNLQKASQDYCMCGMRLDAHYGDCGHSPISEFDWYCREHNL